MPPSTKISVPVTYELSSEAKKVAAFAISEAFPNRAIGILPLELLDISSKNAGETVVLNWKTASETQNRGFFIERSADGNDWKTLGFEAGKGTTTELSQYFFEDKKPLDGLVFYRLRQVDFDGKADFSNIVSIERKGGGGGFSVFPNPTDDGFLTIFFEEKGGAENAVLRLFDGAGRLLKTVFLENEKSQKLDLSGLPTGVFWLEIATEKGLFQQKMIRQ